MSRLRHLGHSLFADWYEKLSYLFIGIIIYLCTAVFEGYWWTDTYIIVNTVLLIAVAVHLLLPVKKLALKIILQLLALLVVHVVFVQFDAVEASPERLVDWLVPVFAYAVQLHPFIWISGTVLLTFFLFGLWVNSRLHMLIFTGVSILLLAIVDSFTPIWLWDEVAWIVFIALLWLVAGHMNQLQRNHPDSWKELLEYPVKLILPMIVIVSILMLVGMNMPSVSPLLQDPYTLWKQSKGERVTVFLGDKLPVSNSSSSSGNSSSGYSRDDTVLGGGFNYDYSTMMTITTSHRSYWRGESKAFYNGEGWTITDREENASIQLARIGETFSDGDIRPLAEKLEVKQHVTIVKEMQYPLFFGAAPINKVMELNNLEESELASELLMWDQDNWSLQAATQTPTSYTLTSEITVLDEEKLRTASSAGTLEADSIYLQLPDTVTDRVRQLAAEVTAEGSNDYDRAKLIESYLKMNYSYNNKPDLSKLTGQSTDFVDQFLFELQEGYCDYFSTAMAVMARSLDMPARWVKGFAPGVLPASAYPPSGPFEEEEINATGEGTYTVRNADAHSWVEIYFEGYGWISFEPTAGFSFPHSIPADAAPVLPEIEITEPEVTAPVEEASRVNTSLLIWLAASVLAVGCSLLLILNCSKIRVAWHRYRHGSFTANDRIVWETHKLLRFCRKRGFRHEQHETLREAVLRWSQSHKRLREEIRYIIDTFERAKYSSAVVSKEDADTFVHRAKLLTKELR